MWCYSCYRVVEVGRDLWIMSLTLPKPLLNTMSHVQNTVSASVHALSLCSPWAVCCAPPSWIKSQNKSFTDFHPIFNYQPKGILQLSNASGQIGRSSVCVWKHKIQTGELIAKGRKSSAIRRFCYGKLSALLFLPECGNKNQCLTGKLRDIIQMSEEWSRVEKNRLFQKTVPGLLWLPHLPWASPDLHLQLGFSVRCFIFLAPADE